jgi:site-specific recombinase XerC
MARNLTAWERRTLGQRALELSALGMPNVTIAERLGINRKTVPGLIKQAAEEADPGKPIEAARAKAHYRNIIRTCWTKLADKSLSVNSHNIPALISQAASAQARLDKLNGIEAPQKVEMSGKMDLASFSKLMHERGLDKVPASERSYTEEYGITRSKIWHPPAEERN